MDGMVPLWCSVGRSASRTPLRQQHRSYFALHNSFRSPGGGPCRRWAPDEWPPALRSPGRHDAIGVASNEVPFTVVWDPILCSETARPCATDSASNSQPL